MLKQFKFFKLQQLVNFKKIIICLIAVTILVGLWHVYGYNLKNKFAKAGTLLATVAPAVNNVDNLAGNTDATWRFTINNTTALSSSTNAVEITFPDTFEGGWNMQGITASSTTADATLMFATTSVAVLNQRTVIVMVLEDQTSADNNFILDIKGADNPMIELESFGNYIWSIKTCVLQTAGDPSSGCNNDIDSAVEASASITRRGGFINNWSFTPSSYEANATGVEYTITFIASTTLNVGEKIHINFPNADFIANATISDQTIIEGGTATVASTTIATSTDYGLNQVILTLNGGAINPSATSTVTIVIGNITNPTKGSYRNLRVFTTTANNGLVDGVFYGIDVMNNFQPPPVDSILIGGTNTVNGIVKVLEANGTLRTVTSDEATQISIGMGCPDMMFFAGTKRVNLDGTFTYGYLLDATYIMGAMPNNTSDSSFFENYLQPNMMQINVTGNEIATVTPTFVVPDSVMQGSITGGPANATGVFIRAYTGDMESFTPIFTTADYTQEGLNNDGTGYFDLDVKSGYTWNLSIMTDSSLVSGTTQYWPPVVDPVYIEPGATSTNLNAYTFVEADKTLNVTLRSGADNSVIDESNPPAPCLNIRRSGTMMMGPSANETCNTTNVGGVNVYQMKVPAGAFVVEIMMPGAGFKEYPITVLSIDETVNKTIIIEQPTSYITGSVTDPDSFAMQGVAVMAQGSNGSFKQTLTNASGEYTLYVSPGDYRIEAFAPSFGPLTAQTGITVIENASTTVNFTITADSFKKITGRVYTDTNNNNLYDSDETTYEGIHIHAFGNAGMNSTMSRSDGTYTLRVPAGTGYTVEAWSQDIGHINKLTNVNAENDIADQDFTVAEQGYLQITITAGNTYGLTEIFAWAYNESTGKGNGSDQWSATSSDVDLVTKFSLPAGNYKVDVGSPAFGNLVNATSTTITANATANITVTLPDIITVSGTTDPNATVWASRIDGPGKFNTTADSNGDYSMKLPDTYTYMIGASLPGYTNTPIEITLAGENVTQNLTLTVSEYSISGTVSSSGTVLKEGFVWAVKAGNNGWTGAEINADGSYTLDIDAGTWTIYAEAPCYSTSNGVSQTGAGTVNISLTAISGCNIDIPDTQSFVPTTGGSISQSDITINIPPNALGTESNNVTLSVAKPSIVPPATLNAAPISSSTKRILVTNSAGNNVSNLNNSIEVTLDYNEDDIPNGADENDLQFAYWNTTTKTWDVVAATIDTTNNTITAKINHLTDFAPIVPTNSNVPDSPTGLSATRNGDTGISLSWTAVDGATSYLIYKDISADGSFPYLATTNSTTYNSTNLSASTLYYYKVSSSNANGESSASSAVSATTCASVANGTVSGSSCTLTCNSGYSESSGVCVANSNGGGGIISTTYCSTIEYDEWQTTCVNNLQYRNVISKFPNNCTLTTEQENSRKRVCGITVKEDKTTLPKIIKETKEKITKIVNEVSGTTNTFTQKIITIASEATEIVKANINGLLGKLGFKRNLAKEQTTVKKYIKALIKDSTGITNKNQNVLTNFISYGTKTTLGLGEGERAGVVNSYKSAFGSLPINEEDWNDVIKIANGRWPGKQNKKAEARATINFRAVYLRNPDRNNPNDDAAITIMAYGLRPSNRNLNSEKNAIKIFKAIYGYNPVKATAWDVVRAIAYSGATR